MMISSRVMGFCSLVMLTAGAWGETGKVTIYRDTWGVPHVYAETAADGAYGLGYAQAEDRLEDIFKSLRTGMGRMAEAYGADFIEQDYIMGICRNQQMAKQSWEEFSPELKELVIAFQAGIEAYMAEHPDKVPESKLDLEPWMFSTIGRAMILRWPLGTIQDDLGKRKPRPKKDVPEKKDQAALSKLDTHAPSFSNEWAVAPSRSADNCAILLTDPHVTWESLALFYEARVHAGPLHMCGFFLVGSPIMGFGHTDRIGWANTTGGPDTADVYEMTIKQAGFVPQYEYDGQWKTPKLSPIKIAVKGQEKPVIRPSAMTHLGPVISPPEGDVAYVAATPYFDATKLLEQTYRMCMAKDAKELYKALGMLELMEQNYMFADTEGTIGYVRNGRTPIRPDGYDWNAPVPGNTSKTAWQGIHPIEDLVQIFNPASGYMQNCNISPAVMMKNSPLTRDKYKPYIFNVFQWEKNPRGERSTALLDADSQVTREDALSFATDVHDIRAAIWQSALKAALKEAVPDREDVKKAADAILAWDGQYTAEATPTVLFRTWRENVGSNSELAPMAKGEALSTAGNRVLMEGLAQAVDEVTKAHGRWDVPWGEVYRVGRSGKFFGVPGADYGDRKTEHNYTETLFDIGVRPDPENPGKFVAFKGSESLVLMFFHKDGVESYTAFAWGQSANPASPHHVDQAEKLFSKRKLKPSFWKKEDLLKNLESEKTLDVKIPKEDSAKVEGSAEDGQKKPGKARDQ